MYFFDGHGPDIEVLAESRTCARVRLIIQKIRSQASSLILILLVAAPSAYAQRDDPLTLAEAERLALRDEPGEAELRARARALTERSVVAGQLPDPMLRMGLANFPIESGGFSTEGMTQVMLGLRQTFPPGDSREINKQQHALLAREMIEQSGARRRDVLVDVRRVWLENYYWVQALVIVADSRPYFENLATVTRSLYAVGRKDQYDVIRADLELSRLDDRLIEIDRQISRSRAMLSEWVGAESTRPIAHTLPPWDSVPSMEALDAGLQSHPAVLAASAKIDARNAAVDLAREQYKPGWAVDLGYGYRDGLLPNGQPRSDFVSVTFSMDLPIFRSSRQDRSLAAALDEGLAAEGQKEKLLRRLRGELEAEYARWQELSRQIDLYDQAILRQSADYSEAALAAYQSEAGDFAEVMRGYVQYLDTRLNYIRLRIERAQSYAVLANLGGFES